MARKKDQNPKTIGKNSGEVEVVERKDIATRFQPGNKLGGRTPGTRNKFAEAFIKDFLADWEVAGASAIQACRLEDPAAYLRVAASLIPKEFTLKDGKSDLDAIIDQLNDEQLAQLHGLLAALSAAAKGEPNSPKAIAGN